MSPSIELFVRSLAPTATHSQVRSVFDRLDELDECDVIEDYTVTVWGEEVLAHESVAETEIGRHVLDSIADFERWAADNGATVGRFYDTRTVERGLTDEEYTVTSLPVMAMAEYDGEDLQCVTPHEVDGIVRSVEDRLDVLAERDIDRTEMQRATPTV